MMRQRVVQQVIPGLEAEVSPSLRTMIDNLIDRIDTSMRERGQQFRKFDDEYAAKVLEMIAPKAIEGKDDAVSLLRQMIGTAAGTPVTYKTLPVQHAVEPQLPAKVVGEVARYSVPVANVAARYGLPIAGVTAAGQGLYGLGSMLTGGNQTEEERQYML